MVWGERAFCFGIFCLTFFPSFFFRDTKSRRDGYGVGWERK